MKTVAFAFSHNGRGHEVRCGALALELFSRGWTASDEPAVWVIDNPSVVNWNSRRVVSIVDVPLCNQRAQLVVCGSPGADMRDFLGLAPRVLAGPDYALLRREFRQIKWVGGGPILDVRDVFDMSPANLARAMSFAGTVVTYGGMRALEAACVGAPLEIHPRNEGEELNAKGLMDGHKVDGFGCQRVADAIEALL